MNERVTMRWQKRGVRIEVRVKPHPDWDEMVRIATNVLALLQDILAERVKGTRVKA